MWLPFFVGSRGQKRYECYLNRGTSLLKLLKTADSSLHYYWFPPKMRPAERPY